MAMKYLGESFDSHGGGIDHLSLHHPNERAQTEVITGKPMAQIWMHTNFMTLNNDKMSKSTGNFRSIREVIEEIGPDLLRYYLVTSTHYRNPDDYNTEKLLIKQQEYEKLLTTMGAVESFLNLQKINTDITPSSDALTFQKTFEEAMDDDLNTPKAVAVLFDYSNWLNKSLDTLSSQNNADLLSQFSSDYILFLKLANLLAIEPLLIDKSDLLVEYLLELREQARKEKNFVLADQIRDHILAVGYKLEDRSWGSFALKLPFKKRNTVINMEKS